jgi:phosphoenolpyruvate-protein kinase (PTS system EI component)
MSTRTIHGISASAGIAVGPIFRYETREHSVEERHVEDTAADLARLDTSLAQAQQDEPIFRE